MKRNCTLKNFAPVPLFGNVLVKTRFMVKFCALSVDFNVPKDYLTTVNAKIWLK